MHAHSKYIECACKYIKYIECECKCLNYVKRERKYVWKQVHPIKYVKYGIKYARCRNNSKYVICVSKYLKCLSKYITCLSKYIELVKCKRVLQSVRARYVKCGIKYIK